jgi:hypothetical protein
MRHFALSVVLSLSVAACAAPPDTGNVATGTVSYDRSERVLSLHGQLYEVPESTATHSVRSGDEVTINWVQDGDRRVVTRMRVEKTQDDAD